MLNTMQDSLRAEIEDTRHLIESGHDDVRAQSAQNDRRHDEVHEQLAELQLQLQQMQLTAAKHSFNTPHVLANMSDDVEQRCEDILANGRREVHGIARNMGTTAEVRARRNLRRTTAVEISRTTRCFSSTTPRLQFGTRKAPPT